MRMGRTNPCLRCVFLGLTVLFVLLGGLLIFATIQTTTYNVPGVLWRWLISICILCIGCLGVYAGYSEKIIALQVFTGLIGAGMSILVILGFIVVYTKNQVTTIFDQLNNDVVEEMLKNPTMSMSLKELQQNFQCCGVLGPRDWRYTIPDSCSCNLIDEEDAGFFGRSSCESKPYGYNGPDLIYKRPCKEVIVKAMNIGFNICIGLFFGFAVIALLSLVASLSMTNQVKRSRAEEPIAMRSY